MYNIDPNTFGYIMILSVVGMGSLSIFSIELGHLIFLKCRRFIKRKHLKNLPSKLVCKPFDNYSIGIWQLTADGVYTCSECDAGSLRKTPYCWRCGADMFDYGADLKQHPAERQGKGDEE